MKHNQSWFLAIVIVLLLFFIFFMPSVGIHMRELLGPQTTVPSDAEQLATENGLLAAQLAKLTVVANELPSSTPDTVRAMVYSEYPFNFKGEMTINAGVDEGIAGNDAVLFEGNLLGVVAESSAHSSVVQTIFDPNFRLPVRIGQAGYDALLAGGSYPMLQSIAKTASVSANDIVYSAGSPAPYATPIGKIASVALAPNNLFKTASLLLPYDVGTVQAVEIIRQ
jgi:rod shape-determining protein MreC